MKCLVLVAPSILVGPVYPAAGYVAAAAASAELFAFEQPSVAGHFSAEALD